MKTIPTFLILLVSYLAPVAGFTQSSSTSRTLTFDDLSPGSYAAPIPNGYGGLNWSNWFVINGALEPTNSGFRTGMVTASNVTTTPYGEPASISSTQLFDLNSVYLTSGAAPWDDDLHLEIQGFRGASLVYDNTFTLSRDGPILANLNFLRVDKVAFTSYLDRTAGTYSWWVTDNMVVTIPEPGEPFLFLAGISLTGFFVVKYRSTTHIQRTRSCIHPP